jgi:hypothetical protein
VRAADVESPAGLERALDEALAAAGIRPAYREVVRAHLDEPDERWRFCCGSACDPCVAQIGRAVDAVRRARAGGSGA